MAVERLPVPGVSFGFGSGGSSLRDSLNLYFGRQAGREEMWGRLAHSAAPGCMYGLVPAPAKGVGVLSDFGVSEP